MKYQRLTDKRLEELKRFYNERVHDEDDVGELLSHIEALNEENTKLKQLILLVDPVVSNVVMNDVSLIQWNEFIRCFPSTLRKI